jgi:hypothetical protein
VIPVRVPVGAEVHEVGGVRHVASSHPLYGELCPVCDQILGDQPITLVYVGVEAESRKTAGWMTGAAVACTHTGGVS